MVSEAFSMPPSDALRRLHGRAGFLGLFLILCGFTLTVWDGGEIAPRIWSGFLFVAAAGFFVYSVSGKVAFNLPVVCLFAMTP